MSQKKAISEKHEGSKKNEKNPNISPKIYYYTPTDFSDGFWGI
jgi:hypothetical protein